LGCVRGIAAKAGATFYSTSSYLFHGAEPSNRKIYLTHRLTDDSGDGIFTTARFADDCDPTLGGADIDEDGIVNFIDYAELMESWLLEELWP